MDYVTPFIKWLLQSKYVKSNKIFLNTVDAKSNNIQIVTQQIAKNQDVEYIDGSVLHIVNFTVFDYKSISFNQLVKTMLDSNENIADLLEVGNINEFVDQMEREKNYPEFGDNFEVQRIYCAHSSPATPTIDNNRSPALAKYSIPIVCEVIEYVE